MKQCPKCKHRNFYVTAHITQDWEVDANGQFIKALNDCTEVTHQPSDDDLWTCANCGHEAPGSEFNSPDADEKVYEVTKLITKEIDHATWMNLHAYIYENQQSEDETITITVGFADGTQMDIKCCGSQNGCSWTEAVLFDKAGRQLACSEPADEFTGDWELSYENSTYIVHVKPEPGAEYSHYPRVILIQKNKSFKDAILVLSTDYHVDMSNIQRMLSEAATKHCIDHPEDFHGNNNQCFTLRDYLKVADNTHSHNFGFELFGMNVNITLPGGLGEMPAMTSDIMASLLCHKEFNKVCFFQESTDSLVKSDNVPLPV